MKGIIAIVTLLVHSGIGLGVASSNVTENASGNSKQDEGLKTSSAVDVDNGLSSAGHNRTIRSDASDVSSSILLLPLEVGTEDPSGGISGTDSFSQLTHPGSDDTSHDVLSNLILYSYPPVAEVKEEHDPAKDSYPVPQVSDYEVKQPYSNQLVHEHPHDESYTVGPVSTEYQVKQPYPIELVEEHPNDESFTLAQVSSGYKVKQPYPIEVVDEHPLEESYAVPPVSGYQVKQPYPIELVSEHPPGGSYAVPVANEYHVKQPYHVFKGYHLKHPSVHHIIPYKYADIGKGLSIRVGPFGFSFGAGAQYYGYPYFRRFRKAFYKYLHRLG